jgi:hypothetical protein
VLFSSLYLQICNFYFGISEYLNFTRELWPEIRLDHLDILKQCDVYILALGKRRKSIRKVILPLHHRHVTWFARAWGLRCSLLANFSAWHARASQTRYSEKFIINISSPPYVFKRNFLHESTWIQGVFHSYWLSLKSQLEGIQFFLHMKYRIFGQAVSKYTIVLVCVIYDSIWPTVRKVVLWGFQRWFSF